jgi:hypothetical protein
LNWWVPEQRKRKLESFKLEEDCKSAEERLYTDIKKLNERRKNNILQMKVHIQI